MPFVCVCVCAAASNRQQLVTAGAIPVLIKLLQSQDEDVQYYSAAAISNLAVDGNSTHDAHCISRMLCMHDLILWNVYNESAQYSPWSPCYFATAVP